MAQLIFFSHPDFTGPKSANGTYTNTDASSNAIRTALTGASLPFTEKRLDLTEMTYPVPYGGRAFVILDVGGKLAAIFPPGPNNAFDISKVVAAWSTPPTPPSGTPPTPASQGILTALSNKPSNIWTVQDIADFMKQWRNELKGQ